MRDDMIADMPPNAKVISENRTCRFKGDLSLKTPTPIAPMAVITSAKANHLPVHALSKRYAARSKKRPKKIIDALNIKEVEPTPRSLM